jgi:glycine/D-amino acid oxidase-like deaminating enzyme/nitrite reductase/ring-hydroxylating ferredoxin subunit
MPSGPMPTFSALDRDVSVDVAVIGGGLTGITAAYLLKKAGMRVALLERRRLASIDTGHTTAHVAYVTDTRLAALEKSFGRDHAAAAWDAGRAALWQIGTNVDNEEIDCDFQWVTAWLHQPAGHNRPSDTSTSELRHEAELAAALGFDASFVDRVPFMGTAGIGFEGQALFHPRKYLRALVDRISGGGSIVCEHTTVEEVESDPLVVTANGYRVSADYLVVATHTPLVGKSNLVSATLLQTKLALYTTYAMAAKLSLHDAPPEGSYWDTADPYLYLRVEHRSKEALAILGGEDHKTGQTNDEGACYARLEQKFRKLLPTAEITNRWSGQVIETPDGLPLIGETSDRQFIATGYAGNGMTFGTVAAMMACDAVLKRQNPWTRLFDPSRTTLKGGLWDYVRENKDYPYYLIRDRFSGAEGRSLRALRRGEGRILELGGKRVAAYRDANGTVTKLSPICTHMGCVVAWNAAERTWDCPCHGSRFDPKGRVVAGPAESPLRSSEE